jgi:rubrerythrin
MEEKEVDDIASAVTRAISKLNADSNEEKKESETDVFACPECGTSVKGMTTYCPGCGCELEWGD